MTPIAMARTMTVGVKVLPQAGRSTRLCHGMKCAHAARDSCSVGSAISPAYLRRTYRSAIGSHSVARSGRTRAMRAKKSSGPS